MKIIEQKLDENEIKTKKTMRIIAISIVILLVISIILFITIYNLRLQLFKFNINGKRTSMPTNNLFVYEGNKIYVSLYDIAGLIGYKYYQGGYKEYTEDSSKCYLESDNEVCTFEEDENIIYKTPKDKMDYEYYEIDEKVKTINNKLYITSKGLERACNLTFYYDSEKNDTAIYTLQYYVDYYMKNNKFASVSKNYNNQKALMYGLLVTQSVENTEKNQSRTMTYGVSKLNGEEIVGKKYTDINFIESTEEFIVKTEENKVGIITKDGETKVKPEYDSIKQIDKDLNLYLVELNKKQGVVEKDGRTLVYTEYDKIGVDASMFTENNIKNPYLLFNNAIPVQQNGKWGLYDKKGNLILPLQYDGMGCTSNNNRSNNLLIIPSIKTIVVAKNYEEEKNRKVTYYGMVNYLGREIVPTSLNKLYTTVNNGRKEYYMEYNDEKYNVIENIRKIEPKLDELNDETKANKTTEEIRNNS